MDKQLFDDAIGEVPPSTVDVDAAIARGRRAARFRSLGSPVVAVAAGVVLVIGGVAVAVQPQRTSTASGREGVAEQSPCAALSEQPADSADRLTDVLKPLIEWRLPNERRLVGDTPGPLVFTCHPSGDYFGAHADVVDTKNQLVGRIMVQVGRHDGGDGLRLGCGSESDVVHCDEEVGPHGEHGLATTAEFADTVEYQVEMAKPDGTLVSVAVTNDIFTEDSGEPGAEESRTNEEIIEIVLDSELTLAA